MAYVQGSLGEKISKTMDDAAALFKQGDYQQSIDMFARAWDLLPDSKYSYVHVLLGKHADTGNVVRNQTAHAGDSAVLTSMYSAMRRS